MNRQPIISRIKRNNEKTVFVFEPKKIRPNHEFIRALKGSITVEAALIMPLLMMVFLFFVMSIEMVFAHAKIQIALDQICKEITYESYFLEETGIIDAFYRSYQNGDDDSLDTEGLSTVIDSMKTANTDVSQAAIDFIDEDGLDKVIRFMETISEETDLFDKIKGTGQKEATYFIGSRLLRAYINHRMETLLGDEDIDYHIDQVSGFLEADEGFIVLETRFELPILFIPRTLSLKNGGYFHGFSGAGVYTVNESEEEDESGDDDEEKNRIVYVTTKSGSKYHYYEDCRTISVKVEAIKYSERGNRRLAKGETIEENPDPNRLIYVVKDSQVYHSDFKSAYIYHELIEMTEEEAIEAGYSLCKVCEARAAEEEE